MESHLNLMVRRSGALMALILLATLASGSGTAATSHDETDAAASVVATAAPGSELADLASGLDYDPEKIFRFVADEIRYEPYTGILRGATGTLDSRAGNSVDQALLLASLLEESAIPFRFARGTLDQPIAAKLIESIAVDAADARLLVEDTLAGGWDELARGLATIRRSPRSAFVVDEEALSAMVAEAEERLELAERRLADTVGMIESALAESGIDLPAEAVSLPPAELVDHTWVQVPFGAGWLDLDPTMSASEPGIVLTPASETLDRLPDDLRHRVEFEVLVERVSGGQLVPDPVLEHAVFADQITGVPLTFGHITPGGAERFGIALRNVLGGGQIEYRPTLDVGRGTLVADESVELGIAGSEGGGGLFEGTDLFTDGTSSTDPTGLADGEATAEWLTVRVTGPGSEPVVARRTVFDRVPANLRYEGSVVVDAVDPIELVDLDGNGSSDFAPMLGMETFVIATGTTDPAALLAPLSDADPDGLGMFALAYHGLRDTIAAEIAIDAGARTFVDGPNIVSYSLDVDVSGQEPSLRVGLDIWHQNHGVLPLTGPSMTVAGAELVAGVTGHLAEQIALEGLAGTPDSDLGAVGVGALFEAAASGGVPTVVLHGAVLTPLPYDATASALIEEAVESGAVVIIPSEPVVLDGRERVGWWSIDAATGVTADMMDDGSGSFTEETGIVGTVLRWAPCALGVGLALFDAILFVAVALESDGRQDKIGFLLLSGGAAGLGLVMSATCRPRPQRPPTQPALRAPPPRPPGNTRPAIPPERIPYPPQPPWAKPPVPNPRLPFDTWPCHACLRKPWVG